MISPVGIGPVELPKHGIEAERERRVGARLDLTEKQATLLLDFVRRQRRLQGDLRDERQQGLPVDRERLSSHFGGLDFAVRVEAATDVFGALGQLHRRPPGGAAEHRAVQEVGDAGGRFGFDDRDRIERFARVAFRSTVNPLGRTRRATGGSCAWALGAVSTRASHAVASGNPRRIIEPEARTQAVRSARDPGSAEPPVEPDRP